MARPAFQRDNILNEDERARLEREVIEAAKAWRAAETRTDGEPYAVGFDRFLTTGRAFRAAVTALIEFESNQLQVKK